MKKILLYILPLFALLSCTSEEDFALSDDGKEGATEVTIYATRNSGAKTRTDVAASSNDLTSKWKVGDLIYVYNDVTQVGILKCTTVATGGTTGTFSGQLSSTAGTLKFYYLGDGNYPNADGTFCLDFQPVTGVAGLNKYDVAKATGTVSISGSTITATSLDFANVLSYIYVSTTNCGAMSINKALAINLLDGTVSRVRAKNDAGGNGYTLAANTSYYVPFVPGLSDNVVLTGLASDSKVCFVPPFATTAGKIYSTSGNTAFKIFKDTHEAIDLGLPSGIYWAKFNMGVDPSHLTVPLDYFGDYYAWADPEKYYYGSFAYGNYFDLDTPAFCITSEWKPEKNGYLQINTKYRPTDDTDGEGTKYNTTDGLIALESCDDPSAQNWQGTWVTPSLSNYEELVSSCYIDYISDYKSTSTKGYIIYKVKSNSDKGKSGSENAPLNLTSYSTSDTHLFLPYNGWVGSVVFCKPNLCGHYWLRDVFCSSVDKWNSELMYLIPGGFSQGHRSRDYGFGIRPVCP